MLARVARLRVPACGQGRSASDELRTVAVGSVRGGLLSAPLPVGRQRVI